MKLNITYLSILLLLSTGCSKKEVLLPQIPVSGITELYDYSQVWAFYDESNEQNQAKINKNNTISTTHWIINIDRRLSMHEVTTVIGMVNAKRAKKSMHSAEGKHNYISYANTQDKNISLFEIDSLQILVLDKPSYNQLTEELSQENVLTFNQDSFILNQNTYPYNRYIQATFDTIKNQNLHVFFSKDVDYQQYLEKRIVLTKLLNEKIKVNNTEFMTRF
jgi:hypothetical protein